MNDDQAPTIEDLQGKWRIVSVGEDGGKAPFFVPWLFKLCLEVDGNRYTKFVGARVVEKLSISVSHVGWRAFGSLRRLP